MKIDGMCSNVGVVVVWWCSGFVLSMVVMFVLVFVYW